MAEIVEVLSRVPLFAGIQREKLAKLADQMAVRRFSEGESATVRLRPGGEVDRPPPEDRGGWACLQQARGLIELAPVKGNVGAEGLDPDRLRPLAGDLTRQPDPLPERIVL